MVSARVSYARASTVSNLTSTIGRSPQFWMQRTAKTLRFQGIVDRTATSVCKAMLGISIGAKQCCSKARHSCKSSAASSGASIGPADSVMVTTLCGSVRRGLRVSAYRKRRWSQLSNGANTDTFPRRLKKTPRGKKRVTLAELAGQAAKTAL